jgi:uncharacterized protein YceK
MRRILVFLLIALVLLSGCSYQVVENTTPMTVTGP